MPRRLADLKAIGVWFPSVVLIAIVLAFAVGLRATPESEQLKYLSPGAMAISADGSRLYVVCERGNQLLVADAHFGKAAAYRALGQLDRAADCCRTGPVRRCRRTPRGGADGMGLPQTSASAWTVGAPDRRTGHPRLPAAVHRAASRAGIWAPGPTPNQTIQTVRALLPDPGTGVLS